MYSGLVAGKGVIQQSEQWCFNKPRIGTRRQTTTIPQRTEGTKSRLASLYRPSVIDHSRHAPCAVTHARHSCDMLLPFSLFHSPYIHLLALTGQGGVPVLVAAGCGEVDGDNTLFFFFLVSSS